MLAQRISGSEEEDKLEACPKPWSAAQVRCDVAILHPAVTRGPEAAHRLLSQTALQGHEHAHSFQTFRGCLCPEEEFARSVNATRPCPRLAVELPTFLAFRNGAVNLSSRNFQAAHEGRRKGRAKSLVRPCFPSEAQLVLGASPYDKEEESQGKQVPGRGPRRCARARGRGRTPCSPGSGFSVDSRPPCAFGTRLCKTSFVSGVTLGSVQGRRAH